MLILSKFRDYYDTAAAHGVDKTCVYRRERKDVEIHFDEERIPSGDTFNMGIDGKVMLSFFLVGFAGKFYPGAKVGWAADGISYDTEGFYYSAEDLFEALEDSGIEIDVKTKVSSWRWGVKHWRGNKVYGKATEQFFAASWEKQLERMFREHHSPVLVILNDGMRRAKLIVNYNLKTLFFQKVKDPYTAHQEIYMYLSGVLGQPLEPPKEPSDKEKAQIHGHDGEYSFKKPPGGKKWR